MKKGKKNNQFSERNRPLRTQEQRFRALKFEIFWGSMLPDPAKDSHPRRSRDVIRILFKKYPDFTYSNGWTV